MRSFLFLIFVGLFLQSQAQNKEVGKEVDQVHPRLQIGSLKGGKFQPRTGGISLDQEGNLYICTWTTAGSVYKHSGKTGDTTAVRIAAGLAEPLGIQFYNGDIYVAQRQELTRLRDMDSDGIFESYETIYDDWTQSGNFHELAFGLPMMDEHLYLGLSVPTSSNGKVLEEVSEDRGKILKISLSGEAMTFAQGLNTPSGISVAMENKLLVSDQLGKGYGFARLLLLSEGDDAGFHAGTLSEDTPGPLLLIPRNSQFEKSGQAILLNEGPYKGQILIGDVVSGRLARATIEEVNGQLQACLYHFSLGFDAGIFRMIEGPKGEIYIGGLDGTGNWGFPRSKRIALHRLAWQDAPVFELSQVRAKSDGFLLQFSEPLAEAVQDTSLHLQLEQWSYQNDGTISDTESIEPDSIHISADRQSVFIKASTMTAGKVVHIKLNELLISNGDRMILNPEAWYTLNQIPDESGLD